MMAAGKPSVVRQVCVGKSALFNIAQRAREWLSDDREGAQSLPDIPSNAVPFSFDGLASKDQSCSRKSNTRTG